jgi:L-seryl-tRNA(Ser) seleniumtransferase
MVAEDPDQVRIRATRVAEALEGIPLECQVVESSAVVGGGTYPEVEIGSFALRLTCGARTATELARLLREGDPPVIARVEDDSLLLDLRTVTPGEEEDLVRRVGEVASLA